VLDATLVTSEPARISEYAITTEGRLVDRFRADGVVVATPLGSHGYAHAAGGPVLAVDADSFVTVPIAPFAIGADHWVLPSTETSLSVEREEAPVDCFADADRVGAATPGEPVHVRPDGVFRVVRPPGE
jgi:NAD+ kinase